MSTVRTAVMQRLDWAPTASTEATARFNAAINLALKKMHTEVPFLFQTEVFRFYTQADYEPIGATDLISVVNDLTFADPWVFVRDISNTEALVLDALWTIDGSWNGRVLEVTDSNGDIHYRKIRRVWQGTWKTVTYQFITVEEPWHNQTDVNMTYAIRTVEYPLPSRISEISVIKGYPGGPLPREFIPSVEGEWRSSSTNYGSPLSTSGSGGYCFRRGVRSLPTPTYTPQVTTSVQGTSWLGPEPPGTWEFRFTHSFGRWDPRAGLPGPMMGSSPATINDEAHEYRRTEPLLESPPSPVSAQVTNTNTQSIIVGLPDVDFELGFGDSSTYRYHTSGVRTRIYARRVAIVYNAADPDPEPGGSQPTGYAGAFLAGANIETNDNFFLLDDVPGYTAEYIFRGRTIADKSRRLGEHNQHTVVQFFNRLAGDVRMEVIGTIAPYDLLDDAETPYIRQEAVPLLIHRAAMLACPTDNPVAYEREHFEVRAALRHLRGMFGTVIPKGQPIPRRLPRYGRRR